MSCLCLPSGWEPGLWESHRLRRSHQVQVRALVEANRDLRAVVSTSRSRVDIILLPQTEHRRLTRPLRRLRRRNMRHRETTDRTRDSHGKRHRSPNLGLNLHPRRNPNLSDTSQSHLRPNPRLSRNLNQLKPRRRGRVRQEPKPQKAHGKRPERRLDEGKRSGKPRRQKQSDGRKQHVDYANCGRGRRKNVSSEKRRLVNVIPENVCGRSKRPATRSGWKRN